MPLIALVSAAVAGTAVYSAELLSAGEAIRADQIYEIDVPEAFLPAGAFRGSAADLVGRVPSFHVPIDTMLREAHLLPEGAAPGPDGLAPAGTQVVKVALPTPQSAPAPTDLVDVYVPRETGWCLVADRVLVAGVELVDGTVSTRPDPGPSKALFLAIPDDRAPLVDGADARAVVRNPNDRAPSASRRCEVSP